MIPLNKTSFFLLVAALGVWGCARSGPGDGRDASRVRTLEAKIAKLEEEVQTMQAARDHLKAKLDTIDKDRAAAAKLLQGVTNERNELRAQLLARTGERDTLQAQYDNFRKEIRNLLGQADANAGAATSQPVTAATTPPPTPGKS